ncbi:MAG: BON domain-containing protein [Firmicutes bacterium]|nr:BON domain-containing protein [Bacillota bacterium]
MFYEKGKDAIGGERPGRNRRDLAHQVRQSLEADEGMRAYGIKVEEIGGKIRLWGIVDVLAERNRAEEIARGVPGVVDVVNDITISTDGEIVDSDVAFEAREELALEPGVDIQRIGPVVKGGTVILKGEAESDEERDAAMRAASKARGAKKVVSHLKMKGDGIDGRARI